MHGMSWTSKPGGTHPSSDQIKINVFQFCLGHIAVDSIKGALCLGRLTLVSDAHCPTMLHHHHTSYGAKPTPLC